MSKMSNEHVRLQELAACLPDAPDDSDYDAPPRQYGPAFFQAGVLYDTTYNSERYVTVGKADERGVPLLVGAECPEELRGEFSVPADGIELRHGFLTRVAYCDVCDQPGTPDNPVAGPSDCCGIETYCHTETCHEEF